MTLQSRLADVVTAIGADIKADRTRLTTLETTNQNTNRYDTAPIGAVLAYSRKTLPEGYVIGDGARYSNAQYPQGYAAAVAEVAAGNPLWTVRSADQTFTVPNLTDKFLYASGANAVGASGGFSRVTLAAAESGVAPHGHGVTDLGHTHGSPLALAPTTGHGAGSYSAWVAGTDGWSGAGANNGSYIPNGTTGLTVNNHTGAPAANSHENMPPYVVTAMIVKVAGVTTSASVIQGPPGPAAPLSTIAMESWIQIGAAGAPPFQNGWANYDAVRVAKFRKYPDGRVRLSGMVAGGTAASGTPIFTLPLGYRPINNPNGYQVPVQSGNASSQSITNWLRIQDNGVISLVNAGNTWVFLDGVEFDTEQVSFPAGAAVVIAEGWHTLGAAGEIAFAANWSNYGAPFAAGAYRKDPAGYVELKGLVKSSVAGTGQTIFTLPVGYRPTEQLLFDAESSDGQGRIDITSAGVVTFNQGGPTNWISLDGIRFWVPQTTFPAGKSAISVVSALPLGPTDGDEIYFQNAAMAADGIIWHLRYRQLSPSIYKWEYVGGAPLGSQSDTVYTCTSAAYTAGDTLVKLTAPLAGDYDIEVGAGISPPAGVIARMSFQVAATVISDDAGIYVFDGTTAGIGARSAQETRWNIAAAGAAVSSMYNTSSGSTSFYGRRLRMRPVRLG